MPVSDTCIYFIIAILGLAYPISLTVITRLDEKYKSVIILRLFRRSAAFRVFQGFLIASLATVLLQVLWIVNFKPYPKQDQKIYFHDWADISLCVVTALLLLSFFLFIRQLFQYYTPASLVDKLRKRPDDEEHLGFRGLAVLLFTGINLNDENLVQTISSHFSQQFKQLRDDAGDRPLKYPVEYYELVYDTIFHTAKTEYWKVRAVGFTAASGRWLIGSFDYTAIDELTYSWLWNNLRLALKLGREDYVEEFWKNSHQFISTALAPIHEKHDRQNLRLILNQEAVDRREKERERFLEFHTALGGMLLFEKRYRLLHNLFDHTTSIPYRYELLPLTMGRVLDLFFHFWTNDELFFPGKYGFRDADGIRGEFISRKYIARFTALLFIRQYFIASQWYGYEPVSAPQEPETQEKRVSFIRNLPYFKELIAEIQSDNELMDTLGYEPVDAEWARAHHKPTPDELIDGLVLRTEAAYNEAQVQQRAEEEKKDAFRQSTTKIIVPRIRSYKKIVNTNPSAAGYNSSIITGGNILYKKAAFAINQEVTYMNYDTFFAQEIASRLTRRMTELFRSKVSVSFLFRATELFQAVDQLHLKKGTHVLLNFGIDIAMVQQQHAIGKLTADSYKNIPIINIEYIDRSVIRSALIAVRKDQLPWFSFHSPEPEEIDRFNLHRLDQETELHAGVSDVNERPDLRALFPNEATAVLDKSVVLAVNLNMEVRWTDQIHMVSLKLHSDFYQDGAVNDLSEVDRFEIPPKTKH